MSGLEILREVDCRQRNQDFRLDYLRSGVASDWFALMRSELTINKLNKRTDHS
jgi:hypothetical protein